MLSVYNNVMNIFRVFFACLVMSFVVLVTVRAQTPLPEVDVFGPQVGDTVPDFFLVDQAGQTRNLSSILGPNGAMLVFNRSAAW